MIPIVFSLALMLTAFNNSSEKPVPTGKNSAEKKVESLKSINQKDYLNYLMPKVITNVTSGKMTYKKDSNGIYQTVPQEGC